MKNERCVFLKRYNGIDFYLFTPSLFTPYDDCYPGEDEPPYSRRAVHRVRMMREWYKSKYRVVYMKVGSKTVGHFVVGRGGSRIAMSTPADIVIGPVWTIPSERNKGYASRGIDFVLHYAGFVYANAYEYIKETNTPSIRTVEKNGFILAARCREFGILRTIKEDENGDVLVFRYQASA